MAPEHHNENDEKRGDPISGVRPSLLMLLATLPRLDETLEDVHDAPPDALNV